MKRKLTFLIESHLDQRDYIRFGIQYLASRYSVQILDCTHFVYPKIPAQPNVIVDRSYQYISILSTHEVGNIDPVGICGIVIDILGETVAANVIRRRIFQNGGLRVVLRVGKLYFTPVPLLARLMSSMHKAWRFTTLQFSLARVAGMLDKWRSPVRSVDLFIHGGIADSKATKKTSVIHAHSFDYDEWRRLSRSNLAHQGKYALFLDEDIIYHPDYARFGVQPPATEAVYYPAMNRFFNEYERYTGIPVYIALHPRAQYSKQSNMWGNRKLLHGQTSAAVNGASQIFIHFSTSISFAILENKPITHLISNQLMKSFMGRQICGLSHFLNTPLLNIDYELKENLTHFLNMIDITRYITYKNMYLKADGSLEAPLWEIIANAAEQQLVEAD